jgi:hypothetical protein
VDPTDIKFHIFSANTLPELITQLSQYLEFATVDFKSLQSTHEIYYSVEFHPKMFDNL